MTVSIKNTTSSGIGWAKYVLGTRENQRSEAKLIIGDIELGEKITSELNYKSGNQVTFVISFADEDNVTPEQGRKIAVDYMKEFMHGFKDEEYHLDIVEHQDTGHLHYHCRVPKVNLLTNTQLKLYYHKTDLDFKIATINKIADKYDLCTGEDKQKLIPDMNIDRINKWREQENREPFDFSKKKNRDKAKPQLINFLNDAISENMITNLSQLKTELEELGLSVVNEGYGITEKQHYITVADTNGKKLKLQGEIFNGEFYKHNREDRSKAISNNRSLEKGRDGDNESRADIDETLRKERKKRLKFIDKQYSKARERAYERLSKIPEPKHLANPVNVVNRDTNRDSNRVNDTRHDTKIGEEHDRIGNEITRRKREIGERTRRRTRRFYEDAKRFVVRIGDYNGRAEQDFEGIDNTAKNRRAIEQRSRTNRRIVNLSQVIAPHIREVRVKALSINKWVDDIRERRKQKLNGLDRANEIQKKAIKQKRVKRRRPGFSR